MSIVISGIGHVSPAGQGVEALRKVSAPAPVVRTVETSSGPVEVPLLLAPEVQLPAEIPESIQRRMPRISKMALATAIEAVESGIGRNSILNAPTRTGVIVGSAFGTLSVANVFEKRIVLEGPAGASPSLFATSVHNSIASHLSITFGIQGPACTVTTMDDTVDESLRLATDWLNQDIVDHVLVTFADEISDFHAYAAAHRPSCIFGEAAVSFVLSKSDYAPAAALDFESVRRKARIAEQAATRGWLAIAPAFELAVSALRGAFQG